MTAAEAEQLSAGEAVLWNRDPADRGIVVCFNDNKVCIWWDSEPEVSWYGFEELSEVVIE